MMRDLALFRVEIPIIYARRRDAVFTISLRLRGRDLIPSSYHISGFPRRIMGDQSREVNTPTFYI
jgi:hypothetical protein